MLRALPAALPLLLLAACEPLCDRCRGANRSDPEACYLGSEPLIPWTVGTWWVYRVTDAGTGEVADTRKFLVVEAREADGSFRYSHEGEAKQGLRWEGDFGGRFEWLRRLEMTADWCPTKDRTFAPNRLRLDHSPGRVCAGDAWSEVFDTCEVEVAACPECFGSQPAGCAGVVQRIEEYWSVEDAHAVVENQALGGPVEAFCVYRYTPDAGYISTGTYCFAPGVGKIDERADMIEVLVDFCLDGPACCEDERVARWGAPRTLCPGNPPRCVDLRRDLWDCGRCGRACAPGELCRDGECADIRPFYDAGACGESAAVCAVGERCVCGRCVDGG